jgi:hypothetical protein
MNLISAIHLKTRGIASIEQALKEQTEVALTVRGKLKYVVMNIERYQHLLERELVVALADSRVDLDVGRLVQESVAQHLKRIGEINKNA